MLPVDLDIAMLEKCCDVLCNPNEETDKEKGENEWYFICNAS